MFVRIATKRHNDVTDKQAVDYTNATFDNAIELCKLAAKLDIPINPELMCAYPSGEMSGQFAGWNKEAKGYPNSEEGQAAIYKDVVDWGKTHGVIGIRYWAADYEDWGTMGLFKFENKHGIPNVALTNQ